MATGKVGSATAVSYGIGVQNRYSAFLEDEDGLLLMPAPATKSNSNKRPTDAAQINNGNKEHQKNAALVNNQRKSNNNNPKSAAGRQDATNSLTNSRRNEAQQNNKNLAQGQTQRSPSGAADIKRQQHHHQQQRFGKQQQQPSNVRNTQTPRHTYNSNNNNNSNRPGEDNGQTTANSNKFSRNQVNINHQSNHASSQQHQGKEQEHVKPFRNSTEGNQRFNNNNRTRQFQHDDRKTGEQQHQQLDGSTNQQSDDEKRRRQQKRATDIRHKEPDRREAARRGQAVSGLNEPSNLNERAENDDAARQRNMRNRRDTARNQNEPTSNDPKDARVRGRRYGDGEGHGERRTGQLDGAGRRTDRPQRNRNGFGTGSRNSRGEGKIQEKSKPIPNFTDKTDFPLLAS